jgi:hypothetical protein
MKITAKEFTKITLMYSEVYSSKSITLFHSSKSAIARTNTKRDERTSMHTPPLGADSTAMNKKTRFKRRNLKKGKENA